MAFIERFERSSREIFRLQPTSVVCKYRFFDTDGGKKILQLDTFGSSARENPGKQSQTLQMDRAQAKILWTMLAAEFDFR